MLDITGISSWEEAKDNIVFKVVNKDSITDAPKTITILEDVKKEVKAPTLLAPELIKGSDIVKVYLVKVTVDGMPASATVTEELLKVWGVSPEEVRSAAKKNVLKDTDIMPMSVMMGEILRMEGVPEEQIEVMTSDTGTIVDTAFVVTNKSRKNGAACTFTEESLKKIREMAGGRAAIIPSSINETIIFPLEEGIEDMKLDDIADMVMFVNKTSLQDGLFLSDHPILLDENGLSEISAA